MNLRDVLSERTRLRLRLLGSPKVLWRWLVDANPIRPWRNDAQFRELYDRVSANTLVGPQRLFMLRQLALQCRSLDGDLAEIGVYNGGTARLLAETFRGSDKDIHLFDTFAGMPVALKSRDWHRTGDFADTSLETVREYLSNLPRVHLYKGLFPGTADVLKERRFCFVHVDVDIYSSVKSCCEFFYPRVVRSGVLVFDDYGFLTCPGAKVAVDEFFADKPEEPCYLPTGQCLVIKIA